MNKKVILDNLFRTFIVILTNVMLSIATVWFLEPAQLYAGGATGIAQLIHRLFKICFGIKINLGLIIFIVNVPIVLIGFKYVSKRFAIYSVLAVVVQSVATALIPGVKPFSALADDIVIQNQEVVRNYGGILTLAIFGGLLAGLSSGLALRYGTSTGGIDVISQALALHKNITIGNVTLLMNIAIALVGGGILQGDWVVVLYTIIRMILNSLVMDKIHTSYTYSGLHIFSNSCEELGNRIMTELNRGCTFLQVEGAYSHKRSTELYCVVSTYEVEKVMKMVDELDQHAFVTISPVKKIKGNFIKKTII